MRLLNLWERWPELRLGQLIDNAVAMHTTSDEEFENLVYFIDDGDLIRYVNEFLETSNK